MTLVLVNDYERIQDEDLEAIHWCKMFYLTSLSHVQKGEPVFVLALKTLRVLLELEICN